MVGDLESALFETTIVIPRHPLDDDDSPDRFVQGRWQLCRGNYNCRNCEAEAATLHHDCLQLFMRHCTCSGSLARLWLAVTWRKPLASPDIKSSRLPRDSVSLAAAFALAAEKCGVPQMASLPQEVQDIIQGMAQPSFLQRYVAVLDSANWLSNCVFEPLNSLPLSRVSSWNLGSAPELVSEETLPLPFVHYTIDYIGLKRIERLASRPPFKPRRCDDQLFFVESEEHVFDGAALQLKVLSVQYYVRWHT